MPAPTQTPPPTLLDEVRQVLRLHHYPMHTARSAVEWIVRFVRFHGMRSRQDLFSADPKLASFLTDLAVHRNVAAAAQTQAMNAPVFLYQRVLHHSLPGKIKAGRADKTLNAPVALTRDDVAAVLARLDSTAHLVATRRYGSG